VAKVLIVSDIHLNINDQFGDRQMFGQVVSNTRITDKLSKLKCIIEKEKPDLLIDAGDLFDSTKVPEIVRASYFKD
jgi:DNA repair exonuclease SbcCD nuclease subunit